MTTIYRLLNKNAKMWWYHKEVRKNGNPERARELERRSIKDRLRMLRETIKNRGYLYAGKRGFTLHMNRGDRLEGYDSEEMIQIARILKIPIIDVRPVPEKLLFEAIIQIPLAAVNEKPDPKPWNMFSIAPLEEVARMYHYIGANVENI